jgi:GntR family transcriptional regulator
MSSELVAEPPSLTTTRSIARSLRESIERGQVSPDSALPSYRSIADTYGVAVNTAREAIRILVAEGYVIVRHGAGTFVRTHSPMVRYAGNRYATTPDRLSPFRAECKRLGKVPRTDFLSIERVRPPVAIAERLHVATDKKSVICRRSLHAADGVPIQLVEAYVRWSAEFGPAFLKGARTPRQEDIYDYLAMLGTSIAHSRDEISTRMPRRDEISYLELPPGTPVLDILHSGSDNDGTALEVTRFVMRGDESVVLVDQAVDDKVS